MCIPRARLKAAALAAAAVVCAASDALAAPPELPVVTACGHHDYPPWNWLHEGQIVGACADVARRAIERLGYRVDLAYVGPWKRCQALIEAGEVDVNICSFRNPEREGYSVMAEPRMAQNRIAVFVPTKRAQQMRFTGWNDLKGLRSGLVLGVSMGSDFDDFLEEHTRVQRVTTVASMLQMAARDRLDIIPFGWEAGMLEIERIGLRGQIVPLPRPALVGDLYVSVSKRSPLVSRVQEIGAYFARPGYGDELHRLLDEHHRRYLDGRTAADAEAGRER